MDPRTAAQGAADAGRLLLDHLRSLDLDDGDVGAPSLLEGWSVAHLLTHIARNADSHRRLVEGALAGTTADQYPGGDAQRTSEIEDGARRGAAELVDDLMRSDAALTAAFARVDAGDGASWDATTRRWGDQPWPLADVPFLRWREVALHSTDLGLGFEADRWADGYVEHELHRQVAFLPQRLAERRIVEVVATDLGWSNVVIGLDGPPAPWARAAAPARDLLGWLTGRSPGEDGWPDLGPWARFP